MEEADDEYESLPQGSTLTQCMVAGATAGFAEHVLLYPIDPIKTRMQQIYSISSSSLSSALSRRSFISVAARLIREEGAVSLLRGIGPVLLAAGPAHALYFPAYEATKRTLTSPHALPILSSVAYPVAGVAGTLLHDALIVPADAVKQRVQLSQGSRAACNTFRGAGGGSACPPNTMMGAPCAELEPGKPCANSFQVAKAVVRRDGVLALYRAYPTQLVMNAPFAAIFVTAYESCQNALNPAITPIATAGEAGDGGGESSIATRPYRPLTHIISGGLAGAVAALLTNPFDVVKTFLNTRDQQSLAAATLAPPPSSDSSALHQSAPSSTASQRISRINGLLSATRFIIAERGWSALMRGASARVVYTVPGTAISWSVYEAFKHLLASSSSTSFGSSSSSAPSNSSWNTATSLPPAEDETPKAKSKSQQTATTTNTLEA